MWEKHVKMDGLRTSVGEIMSLLEIFFWLVMAESGADLLKLFQGCRMGRAGSGHLEITMSGGVIPACDDRCYRSF